MSLGFVMYPRLLSKQTLTQLLLIAMISFISINCLTSDIAFTSEIDSWTGRKELLDRGKSEQTIRKLNYITNKFLGRGWNWRMRKVKWHVMKPRFMIMFMKSSLDF